jgi:AcrR family transcriptional regulator
MGDVAAAAEISRGTLYRYFPNRESLLLALEAAANEEGRVRLAEASRPCSRDEGFCATGAAAVESISRPPSQALARQFRRLISGSVARDWRASPGCPATVPRTLLVIVAKIRSAGTAFTGDISAIGCF